MYRDDLNIASPHCKVTLLNTDTAELPTLYVVYSLGGYGPEPATCLPVH